MTCRVTMASGGTGGHFYPTLAIARELARHQAEVTLAVAGQHADEHLRLAAENGLTARQVPAFRLPRNLQDAVLFVPRVMRSVRTARAALRETAPDVVLGMGSFAAVPTCLAAVRLGLPLVLHEGNAWMGRTNRFLSRWAVAAGTSLPLTADCRVRCRVVRTGMPLRPALVDAAALPGKPLDFLCAAGLQAERRTLLVFGGSQGARFINDLLGATVPLLGSRAASLQVIHLTGTAENAPIEAAYSAAGVRAWVRRSDPDIQNGYRAADLVICRAGASSLCELALFGKPAILIPLPTAAEDHQSANARTLAEAGAAFWLPQTQATPTELARRLGAWLADPAPAEHCGQAIRAFAVTDAAARMAQICIDSARPADATPHHGRQP